MYTLNLPSLGGALMNGLGQVRLFETLEDAEHYATLCEREVRPTRVQMMPNEVERDARANDPFALTANV